MEHLEEFPFIIGQKVEARSNIKGYRGAWFRCEIKDIHLRRGEIWCAMQYLDFPDEKVSSTKAYQQDTTGKKKRVLMLRPSFPSIYRGFDNPAISGSVGAVVVINGEWQVGDLVDWWSDGCYWGAKIIAVINRDFVQVELPNSPIGEGGRYEAAVKDIRPSLDWSVEQLWTVPFLKSFSNNQMGGVALSQESSGWTGQCYQPETLKNERFFIAKQEPLTTTVVRGANLYVDEEAELKSKAWFFECNYMFEGHNAPDVGHSTDSYRFGEPAEVIAQDMPFTVSGSPLIGNSSLSNQASTSHTPGIENSANFRNDFPSLNKSLQRDQLNCSSKECAGDFLAVKFLERDKRGKDCEEGKTDPTGRLRASRFKELDPFTMQIQGHETGRQIMESNMFGREESMVAMTLDNRHFCDRGCVSPSVSNQTAGALSDQTIDILVKEGKCLDVDDLSIGSSIIALEELVSRVVWLKGVLQLGLKGWSQERHKRKWTLCEIESPPGGNFEQDGKYASLEQGSENPLLKGTVGSPLEVADQEVCLLASSSGQSGLA